MFVHVIKSRVENLSFASERLFIRGVGGSPPLLRPKIDKQPPPERYCLVKNNL